MILDQHRGAAIPGIVGAKAKVAVPCEDEGAGARVADLESHRVIRPPEPGHDVNKGLIGAELQSDGGVAAVALAPPMALDCFAVSARDADETVAFGAPMSGRASLVARSSCERSAALSPEIPPPPL